MVSEMVTVVVPSSEGWEDVDDIHWFYGFTTTAAGVAVCSPRKTLVVRFPTTAGWDSDDLTGSLLALIELGQELLRCQDIFLAVKRNPEELNNLVHTLMYVGFEVEDPSFEYDNERYLALRLDVSNERSN